VSDTYLPSGLPAPTADRDGVDGGFWEATRRHQLAVQRCRACGSLQAPAEWICHRCHSRVLEWAPVSGRGRIFSWIRVHHAAHPALRDAVPYLVVLVELADALGVRMIGNLLGPPEQEVAIGAEVDAVFEDHPSDAGGYTLVQWRRRG
jgi:uncharacterized OB-fold protein